MNLYLFPTYASFSNGYGIAVESDFKRCSPSADDIIVWRETTDSKDRLYIKEGDFIIKQNSFFSLASIINTLKRTNRSEVLVSDVAFLRDKVFDNIFCGDVCFYNAIRKLFPKKTITVRFHNCFARIYDRKRLIGRKLDLLYSITLKNMYILERRIFNDSQVNKIFISDEDRYYYTSFFGKISDSATWNIMPNRISTVEAISSMTTIEHRLVWFGGVESHKKKSVEWFINTVYPQVLKIYPDLELHLWGRFTEQFDNPQNHVFGHGFYSGKDSVPLKNALYINPDVIGGGVKMKLITYFENNVPFISSIYGFEGFPNDLINDDYCLVVEENNWFAAIDDFFHRHSANTIKV